MQTSISCSKVSLTLWLIAAEATFWYFYVATPLSRERLSCHLWRMWSPAKRKDGSELWWLDSPPFDLWSNHNPCFTLTNRPFLEHRGTSNHNISCHHKIGKNVQCSIENPIVNILKHFFAFPNSFVSLFHLLGSLWGSTCTCQKFLHTFGTPLRN